MHASMLHASAASPCWNPNARVTLNMPRTCPATHPLPRMPAGGTHNDFFTSPATKVLFRDYVAAIVGRVNTITGRPNRDDPAIM